MSKLKWVVIIPVVVALAVSGATWAYLNMGDDPPERFVDAATTVTAPAGASTGAAREGTDGIWKVSSGSQAGYRIKEILFGQSATAVGRTTSLTGQIEVDGSTVKSGEFSADMATVTSDRTQRDGQFRGRIMEVSRFPTATFTLTEPIDLGSFPAVGGSLMKSATGDLTLHGVTKKVTFNVEIVRSASSAQIATSIPIVFADYGIGNPSGGPAQTEDRGELEVLLILS